jgi:hypothetical protein
MYRTENNQYPVANSWEALAGILAAGNFMKATPTDPRSPTYFYVYQRGGTGYEYSLYAYLEAAEASIIIPVSCGDKSCNYRVQSP